VNQYREGKVKSTPTRGVKQYLKPSAYNQSELDWTLMILSAITCDRCHSDRGLRRSCAGGD